MSNLEFETIRVDREGPVDWLTLNRPETLNALNTQMVTDLRTYFSSMLENIDTRVIVMRGEGRAFCAGLDIKAAGGADSAGHKPVGQGWGFQGYLAIYILTRRPQPIISLVGACLWRRFAFVLASDIRVAAESARMNAAFIRIGLSACDMGTSTSCRVWSALRWHQPMLTGRFINAERVVHRLVSEVVPDDKLKECAPIWMRC